ncbi:Uncharacterised protein [Mycobacteroides abscessus]|nr:Uncharacterised protein [Mycobacteroides abscessus]
MPLDATGRSNVALKKYRCLSGVPPQKPPLSTQPSSVRSSTHVTELAPASRRVWPTLNDRCDVVEAGNV